MTKTVSSSYKEARTGNAGQAAANAHARKARAEAAPPSPSTAGRAYERLLGLPVPIVLGVMWVAGAAMLGSCVLVIYAVISTLVWGR